ncbi:hypothetical protein DFH08DRAFT_185971 [Mycena albidolilacea]|uniref:Uncharacterized protein n=1 Tax=Mycena albidolilacea TaxID=1033008 RepID=A0AAD7F562_9AGAR|nr:hypothetical protein DFH08DRAFT_185971 [Mycena albidolilacea]
MLPHPRPRRSLYSALAQPRLDVEWRRRRKISTLRKRSHCFFPLPLSTISLTSLHPLYRRSLASQSLSVHVLTSPLGILLTGSYPYVSQAARHPSHVGHLLLSAVHPGRGTTQPTPCVATISAARRRDPTYQLHTAPRTCDVSPDASYRSTSTLCTLARLTPRQRTPSRPCALLSSTHPTVAAHPRRPP